MMWVSLVRESFRLLLCFSGCVIRFCPSGRGRRVFVFLAGGSFRADRVLLLLPFRAEGLVLLPFCAVRFLAGSRGRLRSLLRPTRRRYSRSRTWGLLRSRRRWGLGFR